jgi:hypothetical protein
MSTTPEPVVPVEPGTVGGEGVEATQEVQAEDNLPQEGVIDQEDQEEDQEEDEAPRPRLAFPPRPDPDTEAEGGSQAGAASLQPTVHAEEDDDSEDDGLDDLVREDEASGSGSGSDDGEEAYVPATEDAAAKIPKFKKNGKKSRNGDDVGTNGEKKVKKTKKSKEVVQDEDGDDEDAGPALDEGTRESLLPSAAVRSR